MPAAHALVDCRLWAGPLPAGMGLIRRPTTRSSRGWAWLARPSLHSPLPAAYRVLPNVPTKYRQSWLAGVGWRELAEVGEPEWAGWGWLA